MRAIRILGLSIASFALVGCAGQVPWFSDASTPEAAKPATKVIGQAAPRAVSQSVQAPRVVAAEAGDTYRLDAGDRLRIAVAGQNAISRSYEVDAGGGIEVSTIGRVTARGLTTAQLSGAIARKLKARNVRDAHVAVEIETYRPFTIRGAVANPGQYPYVNGMTAETAIAIAGGLKSNAAKDTVTVTGSVSGGDARQSTPSTPVQPGDTITVPE